jgi:hypothetical protein
MLHLPEQGAREDGEKRVDTSRQRLHVVVKQETPSLVRACGTVGVAGPQSHLSVSVSVRVPLPVTMSYSCVCHCERVRPVAVTLQIQWASYSSPPESTEGGELRLGDVFFDSADSSELSNWMLPALRARVVYCTRACITVAGATAAAWRSSCCRSCEPTAAA